MKICLTRGKFTLIDSEDFEFLNRWKWFAIQIGRKYYAVRSKREGKTNKRIYLHRQILKAQLKEVVDHIDGDGLNNKKVNLRVCSRAENVRNQSVRVTSKSGYKGVSWENGKQLWRADISVNGHSKFLGHYQTKEKAAKAYNEMALEYHGEFAKLNQGIC